MIRRMHSVLARVLSIGLAKDINNSEEKKVRLLNGINLTWLSMILMFLGVEWYNLLNPSNNDSTDPFQLLGVHSITLLLVGAIFIFQNYKLYHFARASFLSGLLFMTYMFAFVFNPGKQIEYFFILIGPVSVVFYENRKIQYITLMAAIFAFYLPYLLHFSNADSPDSVSIKLALFIGTFVLISYLKNLNTKMEKLLEAQRNQVLEDANTIMEKNNALEELQKAQNQSFINLAHEIRTPLTIINGSQGVLQDMNLSDPAEEIGVRLNSIGQQAKKIDHVVEDILALSRLDGNRFTLNKELVDISEIIRKLFVDFKPNFDSRHIELQIEDNTDERIMILADPIYIDRAISNLLSNALKYTPAYEFVNIRLFNHSNEFALIEVEDSGIGIKSENYEKIFMRYFQEKNDVNESGGNGIGLAYTQKIIQKHGGVISLESCVGSGSLFSVTLKIDHMSSSQSLSNKHLESKKKIANIEELEKKTQTLLLVEDNVDMRDFIKSILPEYEVIEANNGLEGLNQLSENDVNYIITDYMMPEMDGLSFVTEVKRRGYTCPIMVLTAKSDELEKNEMLQTGVDDYLLKPFESKELKLRIRNSLRNSSRIEHFDGNHKGIDESSNANSFLNKLKVYIEAHCAEKSFNIMVICDAFAMSQSSLYRKIKSKTGLTIKEYITEVRLHRARKLIEQDPEISIKTVAFEIGLANSTYFKKIYEKRFGNTFRA